jgi:glucosamine-6-phosphate deaminase
MQPIPAKRDTIIFHHRRASMNLLTTLKGSLLENFFPAAWDLTQWDACVADDPKAIFERQPKWHQDYSIRMANNVADFDVMLGHELAMEIRRCREAGRNLALILPVGPMGMYRWTVYFLRDWNIPCDHVCGFNMDEWSDAEGNTLPGDHPGAFQYAMETAFYGPLADLTVPPGQRFFATRNLLPEYPGRIGGLRKEGAKLVVVYGIGRACHIAFWEPHFGVEFASDEDWRQQTHRLGARLHPLTIEQNAITSFKSRTTLVPAYANTIGPAFFTNADYAIGGADGELGRGMQWQGLSLWVTLRHAVSRHIPSTWMPTQPGVLYFTKELAGPLVPEVN